LQQSRFAGGGAGPPDSRRGSGKLDFWKTGKLKSAATGKAFWVRLTLDYNVKDSFMSKAYPPFVSMDQALAILVNLDLSLVEYGVMDILQALIADAEFNYDGATGDAEIAIQALAVNVCCSRYRMAEYLKEQLQLELAKPHSPLKAQNTDASSVAQIDISSLSYWAAINYGIDIPLKHKKHSDTKQKPTWHDLKISIHQNWKIRYRFGSDKHQWLNFQKIGLMGSRKHEPNKQGVILVGLCEGKKYPPSPKSPTPAEKKAMSLLRDALQQLTGLQDDPFYPYNDGDGWKPKFTLLDRRRSQDERAKQRAKHESYDDSIYGAEPPDFECENDPAQEWLNERGYR
jgi:hypothetical protein